jgi:two-component system response regulator
MAVGRPNFLLILSAELIFNAKNGAILQVKQIQARKLLQKIVFMKGVFRIVIADDDPDDQHLIADGLKDCKAKIEVSGVYNGLQLMDYLLKRQAYKNIKENPDLILLDLNMPLMNGFEVLSEINKNRKLKDIPIYIITTSRSISDKEEAFKLGAKGFYSKGSSTKDIRRIVGEICKECFEEASQTSKL